MKAVNRRRVVVASLFLLGCTVALSVATTSRTPSASSRSHKTATYAKLPLSFEVNRGQAEANAKFVAHGNGYALLLTDRGEPVLALHGQPHRTSGSQVESRSEAPNLSDLRESTEQALVRLEFPRGNPSPEVQGEQPLPGRSNYLLGNDRSKWLVNVPHYGQVRYRQVYPGVDLLYYAKEQQLEYDFIVSPGTNPDSIRMTLRGAQGIEHGASGQLELRTAAGNAVLHKPVAYQQGPGGEREVVCNYVLDNGELRFALGDYDRSRVLRIDPVLSYSARFNAYLNAIAVDASRNTYIAGTTNSTNFPTTPGALQPAHGGQYDGLIAKLDPTGSTLLFATFLGGDQYDSVSGIALDSGGNVIVAGSTSSSNFPVNHALQPSLAVGADPNGNGDAFVSKLDPSGAQLLYSTYMGGSDSDEARGVAVDANGQVVIAGTTSSSNFPTSAGALQSVYGGRGDAFVAKLDTAKSGPASLVLSTYLGGRDNDGASAVAVDADGSPYVTGSTGSANFPTANAFQSSCRSCGVGATDDYDAFVSKLSADGTALAYSTFLGGGLRDVGAAIALDSSGNTYVTGGTSSANFPTTTGAFQMALRQANDSFPGDAFVSKLNAAGSALVYSSFIGGSAYDEAGGIAVDASGSAFVSGFSYSADFPAISPAQGYGGGTCDDGWDYYPCTDAFVARMNVSGSALTFSTYLGGGTDDSATAIAVDVSANAYVTGTTGGAFPSTAGAISMPGNGFVAKISPASVGTGPTSITLTSSPNPSNQGQSVTLTAAVMPAIATGMVTFRDANVVFGSASLNASGLATFSSGSLSGGNHSIIAEYWGDADFAASASSALVHTVNSISLASAQASATVSRGKSATFPLTVSQSGGLTSAVSFACSGLPFGWSCQFNPATVPAGSAPTQVTLTVQTPAATETLPQAPIQSPRLPNFWLCAFAFLVVLGLYISARRRKRVYARLAAGLGLAMLLLLVGGCGSNHSGPLPITADFTASATSGTTTGSTSLRVTAQ